jgi:hypothetical protein
VVGVTGVTAANGSAACMEDAWQDLIQDVTCRRETERPALMCSMHERCGACEDCRVDEARAGGVTWNLGLLHAGIIGLMRCVQESPGISG